jgi:hypothetical protein
MHFTYHQGSCEPFLIIQHKDSFVNHRNVIIKPTILDDYILGISCRVPNCLSNIHSLSRQANSVQVYSITSSFAVISNGGSATKDTADNIVQKTA